MKNHVDFLYEIGKEEINLYNEQCQLLLSLCDGLKSSVYGATNLNSQKIAYNRMVDFIEEVTDEYDWDDTLLLILVFLEKFIHCWVMNVPKTVNFYQYNFFFVSDC